MLIGYQCDLQQPCGQCVKGRLQCTKSGGFIFVQNEAGSHKTVYKKSLNQAGSGKATILSAQTAPSPSSSTSPSNGKDLARRPMAPLLPKQIPVLALIRQQLIATLISRSTSNDPLNPHPEASMLHSWYTHLFALSSSSSSLPLGPLACYTAFYGRRDNNPSLISVSRRLYAASLGETQRALWRRGTALRDETLAACLSLVTYETLECPEEGMKGYWWHSEGCLRLVELRGPAAHREGLGRVLFEEFRLHGVSWFSSLDLMLEWVLTDCFVQTLNAFRRHRPNYLSSPGWMTLPFQGQPRDDTQRLLDIFLMGPEVLQKADRISIVSAEERFSLMLNIFDDLWAIDHRLQEFEQEIKVANEHHLSPIYWEQPSLNAPVPAEDDDELSNAQNISIHFSSVPVARIITFLWAIQSMVWPVLVDLYIGIVAMGGSQLIGTRIQDLGHRVRWIELVWKVCQSMEYWRSPAALAFGPVRAALQFNVVIDVLKPREGYEGTLRWAEECRDAIGKGWLRILRYNDQDS